MNTKLKNSRGLFKKTMKIAAIAIFTLALIINVKITLTDPFVLMGEQVLATGTDSGTGTGTGTGTGAILEDIHREVCPSRFDIVTYSQPTTITSTISLESTLEVVYRLLVSGDVNGTFTYTYEKKTVLSREQTERVTCPWGIGFCEPKACGQEFEG